MSEKWDFYKTILDSLSDGVYFVDQDRCITYWNRGAERISGYTREQVIAIANKLRALVASSQLSSPKGVIKLHISLGATLIRSEDDVDSLVKRADTLLYQSKTCGRDRVTFSV